MLLLSVPTSSDLFMARLLRIGVSSRRGKGDGWSKRRASGFFREVRRANRDFWLWTGAGAIRSFVILGLGSQDSGRHDRGGGGVGTNRSPLWKLGDGSE